MRINKYISASGHCSRRKADVLVEQGRVCINGTVAEIGATVEAGDRVTVDGQLLKRIETHTYIAVNKPRGVTCTADLRVHNSIVELVGSAERLYPVGRLDKDSEGLIFLTNDGALTYQLLRAANGHEKAYEVEVDRPLTDAFLSAMAAGVSIFNPAKHEWVKTAPCRVSKLAPRRFEIVLVQGLNRQIRRMCEAGGYTVQRLRRVRIQSITLGDLPLGAWRALSDQEIQTLLR